MDLLKYMHDKCIIFDDFLRYRCMRFAHVHIHFTFKIDHDSFFLFPGILSVACNKLQDNSIKIDLPGGRVVNKSTTGSDAGVT